MSCLEVCIRIFLEVGKVGLIKHANWGYHSRISVALLAQYPNKTFWQVVMQQLFRHYLESSLWGHAVQSFMWLSILKWWWKIFTDCSSDISLGIAGLGLLLEMKSFTASRLNEFGEPVDFNNNKFLTSPDIIVIDHNQNSTMLHYP